MQRTRLNTVIEISGTRFTQFFNNPWRRISLVLLGFLSGFFIGAAVSTTAGQDAQWDVVGAGLLLLFVELVSRWVYRQPLKNNQQRSLILEMVNFFKMGIVYSLFLVAFKLGS